MFEFLKDDTTPCLGNNAYQAYVIANLNQISLGDPNWFCHF